MISARQTAAFAAITTLFLLVLLASGAALSATPAPASTPSVIGTIALGAGSAGLGPEGVAIDPERNRIFVSNARDNTVYVINGDTNAFVTITHSSLVVPWGAGYNPNNGKVYVASNGRNSVVVINSATLQVEQEIADSSLNLPDQVVVDPVRNLIYVSNSSGGMITVINGVNNTIAARFLATITTPHHLAIDPSRNRAYITPLFYSPVDGPDLMMVYSTVSYTEIARRNALAGPQGLAVRSVDGRIFVAQNYSNTDQWRVAVVNPLDLSFAVPFPGILVGGRGLMGATYSAGSDRVYVNGYNSNTVDVIDAANNTLIVTLPVGANPASGIAVNPNTGKVYVANRGSGSVTIIQDVSTGPTVTPTPAASPTATATPLCSPDSFEPNSTPAQAKSINTAGIPQSHNICPAGDQDWVSFSVTAPGALTIETTNLINGADTMLFLYAPGGATLLAFNDDRGVASPALDALPNANKDGLAEQDLSSRIVYTFTKPGEYMAMVRDFDATAFGQLGMVRGYKLLISGGPAYDKRVSLPVIISDY